MHGLSIAAEIVNEVINSFKGREVSKVVEVEVDVGELLIDPEELRFIFPIAAKDTPVEGARLVLNKVPASRELILTKVRLNLREGG